MVGVFLVCLFGLIFLNVPISIALIGTGAVMMALTGGIHPQILTQGLIRGIDNYPLLAIPFFMIAGEIMNKGGISKRIVRFANVLLGHVRGGLGYVTVVASMIFAGVSGSAIADAAGIGSVLIPVMKEKGYDSARSTGLICGASCIGPIIPPSIPMIIYAVSAQVSVVKLFLGGILPGILVGIVLMIVWGFHSARAKYATAKRASMKEVVAATLDAFWAFMLPVIILGGIILGIATPTEASVVAVVYALIVSVFIYREIRISDVPRIIVTAMKTTASVMFVVGGAMSAAYMITTAHIPELLSNIMLSIAHNGYVLLFLINILLLLVGCVMDTAPAILILTPILVPLVATFGIDPIHFGVIMVMNLCIGLLTPPVGAVLYVGSGLSGLSIGKLTRGMFPFLVAIFVALLLVTYIPDLVMVTARLIR
ncbi:MAG TPA: TRAP transporter large permease [Spirochaetia bacterium]|nr:TRAP transporter large permease [Spirochaetia bacterium]